MVMPAARCILINMHKPKCTSCCSRVAREGMKTCSVCGSRRTSPEKQKQYAATRRVRAKSLGLCSVCCKRPKDDAFSTCDPCRARQRRYAANRVSRGQCTGCGSMARAGAQSCLACHTARLGRYAALKANVFQAYGGSCACCGESQSDFLAIDHVENNGADHRRELAGKRYKSMTGVHMYRWLKKNEFPDGFQVLCHNCNFSKHLNGGKCVHEND